jgi:hypothetical protein
MLLGGRRLRRLGVDQENRMLNTFSGTWRASLVAAPMLLAPAWVGAQHASSPVSIEIRGGLNWHDVGPCGPEKGSGSGGTVGLAVRTTGAWFASGSVDVFDLWSGESICELDLPIRHHYGIMVGVWGTPHLDVTTPRLAVSLGRRFDLGRVPIEVTAGLGTVRTKMSYISIASEHVDWRPWYGGTVTFFGLAPTVGVQLEWGRRQIAERYYGQALFVAEVPRWENVARMVVTFRPIE